jgi:hypothetical protein
VIVRILKIEAAEIRRRRTEMAAVVKMKGQEVESNK